LEFKKLASSKFRNAQLISIILILAIVCCIPVFIHSIYYFDLLIGIIVNAVLAMTFIILLRTGMINLGLIAFWGVGAYASAILVNNLHLSFWLSLPLSALITGIVATLVGFGIIGKSSGFSFVVLSSVIGMLFSVLVGNISYLGGYIGFAGILPPDPIYLPILPPITFDHVDKVPYFYLALFLVVIVILIIKALFSSRIGRNWEAIGINPQLAAMLGIDVFRYKLLAFALASAIAGLMGSFYAHYQGFLSPDVFGMWQNIYVQIYAILGGIGYIILGPLIGSTIMSFVPELVRTYDVIAPIISGFVLVILMLFLPTGILGLLAWKTSIVNRLSRVNMMLKSLFQ
jgi:branched-chain amino acid transport system permease protein